MYRQRQRLQDGRASLGRLRRLRDEGWVAGTCAGLGRYLAIDPSLVRIMTVFGLLTLTGTTVLAYLLAWAVVPADDPPPRRAGSSDN